jgi:hypothetical protein
MDELFNANQIVVGGVYATRRSSGAYQVWLVVALDPKNVHIAFYPDFSELPDLEHIKKFRPSTEYAFMERGSWGTGHVIFVGVKGVVDSDLQGYYGYIESIKSVEDKIADKSSEQE